jgi:hypothetical protein
MSRIISLIYMEGSEKLYAPVALSSAQESLCTFDKDDIWVRESPRSEAKKKIVLLLW